MTASRIEHAVATSGKRLVRIDDPRALPSASHVDLVLVDWAARREDWGRRLVAWRDSAQPRQPVVILFGPHTDLEAHRAAKAAHLGPMRARSALFAALPGLLSPEA
jgi:hypothetical protein